MPPTVPSFKELRATILHQAPLHVAGSHSGVSFTCWQMELLSDVMNVLFQLGWQVFSKARNAHLRHKHPRCLRWRGHSMGQGASKGVPHIPWVETATLEALPLDSPVPPPEKQLPTPCPFPAAEWWGVLTAARALLSAFLEEWALRFCHLGHLEEAGLSSRRTARSPRALCGPWAGTTGAERSSGVHHGGRSSPALRSTWFQVHEALTASQMHKAILYFFEVWKVRWMDACCWCTILHR